MRRIKTAFLCLIILQAFVSFANAGDSETKTCTGKVIGAQGGPVEGSKVSFYELVSGGTSYSFDVELREEVTTKADGRFTFTNEKTPEIYSTGIILAQKQGLAIGWANWQMLKDEDFEIKLTESKELSGLVVDENDAPVTEAQVSIYMLAMGDDQNPRYITTKASSKFFTTRTDRNGKFGFGQIPAEATAEFLVSKPGKATVCTWTTGSFPLGYTAGQEDIKVVLPIEAKIEGVVVEKGSDKGVAGVQLMPAQGGDRPVFGQEPITSQVDGTFTIDALLAGKSVLGLVTTRDGLAEWVAETVEVTTEAGKTESGVKIEVCKGGVLEVMITDSEEKEPVEKASVNISQEGSNRWLYAISDENGLAQIRLFPGRYQIQGLYKQGYTGNQQQKDFTIEENTTRRLEFQLEPPRKISGIVLDSTGKPVEGATLRIVPGWGGRGETTSEANGKFEITRDRQNRRQDETSYLVIRHIEKNLAAALEIERDTKSLDVKLMPGVVFTGKVVDTEGKALAGAKINVMLRASNWSSPITDWRRGGAVTDTKGRFEVKAIPPEHKYNVQVSTEGYGKDQIQALADDAVDNRLDVGQFTLALANLSVSGLVVDAEDKPVSGARIYAYGNNQPDRHDFRTDAQGRFTIDKVCAGRMNLSANSEGKKRLYGNIETEGGASDVKIVVTQRGSSPRSVPRQFPSLAGKHLPALTGLNLQIDPNEIAGKVILVCFWDMEQRPSRHCIRELSKQAEQFKEKGVVVVTVHASKVDENVLNEWAGKNGIPFTVGSIEADEEKTRFKWGAKALPWLILTNAEHIVQAEGFGIAELGEKIGETIEQTLAVQVEGGVDETLYQKQDSIKNALKFIGTPEERMDTDFVRKHGQLASPRQLEFANKLFGVRKSKNVDMFISLLSDGTKKHLNDGNNRRMLHQHIKEINAGTFLSGEEDFSFFATFREFTDKDRDTLKKHVSFAEPPTHAIVYYHYSKNMLLGSTLYLIKDKGSYKLVTDTLLSDPIMPAKQK